MLSLAGRSEAAAEQFVSELVADYHALDLPPAERAIDYTITLTQAAKAMTGDAVARLRAAGLDDRAIHDVCAVTAYFAFVNRIAEGLGAELEDRFQL